MVVNVTELDAESNSAGGLGFARLLVGTVSLMVGAELGVMLLLAILDLDIAPIWIGILDAALLALTVTPFAYWLLVRPQARRLRALMDQLRRSEEEAQQAARRDGLTGLLSRRALEVELSGAWEDARESGGSLSCLMIDVDEFKLVNDRYGHDRGDEVLRMVAKMISTECRLHDVAARFGGDEFVVILPDTDEAGGSKLAERIRASVAQASQRLSLGWKVTLSVGVAKMRESFTEPGALIKAADVSMYEAKAAGRDCVRIFGEQAKL